MLETVAYLLVAIVALALGLGLALLLVKQKAPPARDALVAAAREEHDERLRAARSQALEVRAEAEAVVRQSLTSIEEVEHRLARREERLDGRLDSAANREATVAGREAALGQRAEAIEAAYQEQVTAFERIRALPPDVARDMLFERVAPAAREPGLVRAEAILRETEEQFARIRTRPASLAVQRTASELVGEFALVPVPIPREEIKGRIIGREGRNIKAFEAATGVELVIDDAPDVVTLSGFDPFRREVARLALLDLVEDGRIHPGRIDEAVKRARDFIGRQLREDGVRAAEAAGVGPIPNELTEHLGRLRLTREEHGDALEGAIRLAGLAAAFAAELRADVRTARRAGFLLDLGRAVGPEASGSVSEITADVLARAGESPAVIAAVRPIEDLYPAVTPEQAAVRLARAMAETGHIARDDETPIRRVDAVERVVALVEGVAEALAFQVGTRVRLLVRAVDPLDTVDRVLLAKVVLERIEASLGPRVGLTLWLLAPRRRGQDGAQGNGAARVEGGRSGRGRSGRRHN